MTNLGKGSRRGLTDGLREFIKVDNERALDVGSLRQSTGTFKVRKPKNPEGVLGCDSLDELTSRAEEVETSKACIDVNHIEPEKWGPPHARRCTKASKEKIGKKCMTPTR